VNVVLFSFLFDSLIKLDVTLQQHYHRADVILLFFGLYLQR
jgi:hypothetical protein